MPRCPVCDAEKIYEEDYPLKGSPCLSCWARFEALHPLYSTGKLVCINGKSLGKCSSIEGIFDVFGWKRCNACTYLKLWESGIRPGMVTICRIPNDLKETLKKRRFVMNSTMNALVIKIDRDSQELRVDEDMEDVTMEEIRDRLPMQEPRYIHLDYPNLDGDRRAPKCFIFYMPPDCTDDLQRLYCTNRSNLFVKSTTTKNFEVRDQDELTQEYVDSKAFSLA